MTRVWGAGFILFILALGVFVYKEYVLMPNTTVDNVPSHSLIEQIKPIGNNFLDIEFKSSKFRISWIKISDVSKLTLFSNLPDTETAEQRMAEKSCNYLVNGGFYSKESRPIGAFVSEGETINTGSRNNLFNGVFSVDTNKYSKISNNLSLKNVRFAVQSGPILISDKEIQHFNLRSDNGERRMVVAIDANNDITFLTIFNPTSVYLGPYLTDLADIIREFEKKSGNSYQFALNLDGGTASAFYSDSVRLPELSPIGSYFCIKS